MAAIIVVAYTILAPNVVPLARICGGLLDPPGHSVTDEVCVKGIHVAARFLWKLKTLHGFGKHVLREDNCVILHPEACWLTQTACISEAVAAGAVDAVESAPGVPPSTACEGTAARAAVRAVHL